MPVQLLFVQGGGDGVHDGWDRALVDSLARALGPDYQVRYPRMPQEDDPTYGRWQPALARELEALTDGAVLVGHSVGGTVLLHALAERSLGFTPGALVLIAAPFIGAGGWQSDDIPPRTDLAERLPAGLRVLLFHGGDDAEVPTAHVHLHARALAGSTVHVLPHRDHQLNDDLREVASAIRAR